VSLITIKLLSNSCCQLFIKSFAFVIAGVVPLPGPPGENGTRGDMGLRGPKGCIGLNGTEGDIGMKGFKGEVGKSGWNTINKSSLVMSVFLQ